MPSVVGNVNVNSVGSGGIVHFGDALYLSPKTTTKSYAGSGSFNTGNVVGVTNGLNNTNTLDNDLMEADQPFNS